jgi:hypothetical protein
VAMPKGPAVVVIARYPPYPIAALICADTVLDTALVSTLLTRHGTSRRPRPTTLLSHTAAGRKDGHSACG